MFPGVVGSDEESSIIFFAIFVPCLSIAFHYASLLKKVSLYPFQKIHAYFLVDTTELSKNMNLPILFHECF